MSITPETIYYEKLVQHCAYQQQIAPPAPAPKPVSDKKPVETIARVVTTVITASTAAARLPSKL